MIVARSPMIPIIGSGIREYSVNKFFFKSVRKSDKLAETVKVHLSMDHCAGRHEYWWLIAELEFQVK